MPPRRSRSGLTNQAPPRIPKVIFQPDVYRGMQRGIKKITRAVRPTLGPLPKLVAIEPTSRSGKPEILDCGGIIARRIIQIQGRDQDMGAMFLR